MLQGYKELINMQRTVPNSSIKFNEWSWKKYIELKNNLEKDFNAERQAEALHFAYHSVGVFPCGYRVIPKCEVWILFANSLEFWNYWIQFECRMKTYDRKLRN